MDDLVREIATKHAVDPELIERLVEFERAKVHLQRRRGAKDELRAIIERRLEDVEERES